MRSKFLVYVDGGDERAREALRNDGLLRVAGPATGRSSGEPIPDGGEVWAVVEADDAEAAKERVRRALPADADYRIADATPIEAY